jgi:serine/threonine-protein phosphatase PGAM5
MQTPSQMVLQVIAWISLLACLAGPSQVSADANTETRFTRTLYLIRHGAYDIEAKVDAEAGPGLTPLGIAQARLVAARLRGLPTRLDSMTSSTMTRARETAAVVHETLADVPMRESPLLSECLPPLASAGPVKESDRTRMEECAKRLDQAFSQFFVPAEGAARSEALICHGNVIRYFVMKALGVDTANWLRMSVAHTSITVIQITAKGAFRVLSVGDVGHIPPNLQSGTFEGDPQLALPKGVRRATD